MPSDTHRRPTRFSGWPRGRAATALAALCLLTAACLWVTEHRATRPMETRRGDNDADLFRHVVLRIHQGETPYDAFQHVFEMYRYPVCSVLNYRLPLQPWLIGHLPDPKWGQALLAALALVALATTFQALQRSVGGIHAAVALVFMGGSMVWGMVGDQYLFTEAWAGILMALSVAAIALERRALALVAGLLAVFTRELALPYALVSLAFACQQRRRWEAVGWGAGLVAFGIYLTAHMLEVAPRIPNPDGVVNGARWVHFGGLAFLLSTCRVNLFFLIGPLWTAAFYLPLSLLGLASGRDDATMRAAALVLVYLAVFSVIGGPFSIYWGLLYAPLLPLGVALAPRALGDLVDAMARRSSVSTVSAPERAIAADVA